MLHTESQELLPAEVLKPTATVHIANDFTFVERKMINAIMADFQMQRLLSGEHEIGLAKLCRDINYTSRNRDPLKEALETLVTTAVKWNVFERDKVIEWGVCTFLSSARIVRGGKVKYRVNEQINTWIANPTLFAKFYLLIQTRFSKKHSLILYELFSDELSRHRVTDAHPRPFTIKDLRHLLGIAKDQYEQFKIFNRAVLKPAVKEINESTDIDVIYSLQRQARKVSAVAFTLHRKASYQLPLNLDLPAPEEVILVPRVHKTLSNNNLTSEQLTIFNQLISHNVAKKQAIKIVETLDPSYVREKIDQVAKEIQAGKKLRNRAGYLVDVIHNDYHSGSTDIDKGLVTDQNRKRNEASRLNKKLERLRPEWEKFKAQRAQKTFQGLPLKEQERHRQRYLKSGGISGGLQTILDQEAGWDNPIVMHEFTNNYLIQELLSEPEEISFEQYVTWKHNSIASSRQK